MDYKINHRTMFISQRQGWTWKKIRVIIIFLIITTVAFFTALVLL